MPENTTVGQRFAQFIAYLGVSKNAFAASLDKTATVIQHLVDERNKPGFDLLCKVFEVYPNLSKDWLLQGTWADGSRGIRPSRSKQRCAWQKSLTLSLPAFKEKPPVAAAAAPAAVSIASPRRDFCVTTVAEPEAEPTSASPQRHRYCRRSVRSHQCLRLQPLFRRLRPQLRWQIAAGKPRSTPSKWRISWLWPSCAISTCKSSSASCSRCLDFMQRKA